MSGIRKSYSGNAVPTTLSGGISPTDMTGSVGALTGYPDTSVGPFVIVVNRGEGSLEEKILVTSYSGLTLTFSERGYDGTSAQSHSVGASVVHTLDRITIDQANDVVNGVGNAVPTTSAVGQSAAEGTSKYPAATDHVHGRESFGNSVTNSNPGDAEAAGTATTPARSDHVHGRETAPPSYIPIGGSIDWWSDSLPPDAGITWLFLHGQTVSGGVATFPTLAARYPAWVSGSDLVMPDTRDKFLIGSGGSHAVSTTGGAVSQTLTIAMIPQMTPAITDTHQHTATSGSTSATHTHGFGGQFFIVPDSGSTVGLTSSPAAGQKASGNSGINTGNDSGTAHTHTVSTTATTGSIVAGAVGTASPTPVPTLPPYIAAHKIVRAA